MAATLSTRAVGLLDMLPYYLREDPYVQAVIEACARELERFDAYLDELRAGMIPSTAAGTFLAMWEDVYGVVSSGTDEQRRDLLVANIIARRAGSGEDWAAAVTRVIGSENWAHKENFPASYQLTVTIPYEPGSADAYRIEQLIKRVTPAHIEVIMDAEGGFRVGVSRVGDQL